eukprot:TRINITY_DN3190_c2_g1_i1.p1 TRINITY_DN3190_c2_g1~~TRINITY_DN3190_c2_g1_i1.p1  ORF type:complete len:136 (-),score=17.45 TRINITY_DN3190_c2_g1_i1:193-600(-)
MPCLNGLGAMVAIEEAERTARAMGFALSVAVVDPAGNLIAFRRMEGAPPISISIAQQKARGAATSGKPTKVFEDSVNAGFTALLNADGLCCVQGGVPLFHEGKLVGAIGCSGASADEDELSAVAAAEVFAIMDKR